MDVQAPWYARFIGWTLLAFGAVTVVGFVVGVVDSRIVPSLPLSDVALHAVLAALPTVGGIGMVLSRRWGWPIALVGVAAWIMYGLLDWIREGRPFPGDPQAQVDPTTIVFLVLPGLAMLCGLLAPATVRWFRAPSRAA